MDVMRIIGIGLCGAAMSLVLRAFGRKEIALLCEIACGIVLLCMAVTPLAQGAQSIMQLAQRITADEAVIALLIRVTGIAVLVQLGAQLCRDAGVGALAQKIELSGKAVILCAALPLLTDLCESALALLD